MEIIQQIPSRIVDLTWPSDFENYYDHNIDVYAAYLRGIEDGKNENQLEEN